MLFISQIFNIKLRTGPFAEFVDFENVHSSFHIDQVNLSPWPPLPPTPFANR